MKTPVERIRELIPLLLEKDRPYAEKFVQQRDFDSLEELVKSDIEIIRRRLRQNKTPDLEIDMALVDLENFYYLVNRYCSIINGTDLEPNDEYDTIEGGEEESFYES